MLHKEKKPHPSPLKVYGILEHRLKEKTGTALFKEDEMPERIVNEEAEKTLERFNKESLDFMIENQNKIACAIVYTLSHLNQPLIAGYQRYFNQNVILKYDSKVVFAHNPDLPDFLCAYFILVRTRIRLTQGND